MMTRSVVTATILAALAATQVQASDSAEDWSSLYAIQDMAPPAQDGAFRWHFSSETGQSDLSVIDSHALDEGEISAIAGQIDFHPFGDEFYLSAGAVSNVGQASLPSWQRFNSAPAYVTLPHFELTDTSSPSRLDELTRYFGAGMTVRTIDSWSVTVEGGAYFGDSRDDQLEMFNPNNGTRMVLLDDLDKVDQDAVGETHARSVSPVGHLVVRRRF